MSVSPSTSTLLLLLFFFSCFISSLQTFSHILFFVFCLYSSLPGKHVYIQADSLNCVTFFVPFIHFSLYGLCPQYYFSSTFSLALCSLTTSSSPRALSPPILLASTPKSFSISFLLLFLLHILLSASYQFILFLNTVSSHSSSAFPLSHSPSVRPLFSHSFLSPSFLSVDHWKADCGRCIFLTLIYDQAREREKERRAEKQWVRKGDDQMHSSLLPYTHYNISGDSYTHTCLQS